MSDNFPTCAVPKTCNNVPTPTAESKLANSSQASVKAYRSIEYTCKNSSDVMETHGRKYKLNCLEEGNFDTPTWPSCKAPLNCTGPIPIPSNTSNLANSTSDLVTMMEWDEAVYKCEDSNHVIGKKSISCIKNCDS